MMQKIYNQISRTALMGLLSSALFIGSAAHASKYYWIGFSGAFWETPSNWATTTGGSTLHTIAPGSSDTTYFDANSFIASGSVVQIQAHVRVGRMDWSQTTNNPVLYIGNNANLFIGSGIILSPDMIVTNLETTNITLEGPENSTVSLEGNSMDYLVAYYPMDTLFLLSDLHATGIGFESPGFVSNGHNITVDHSLNLSSWGLPGNMYINIESSNISVGGWEQSAGTGSIDVITSATSLTLTNGFEEFNTTGGFLIDSLSIVDVHEDFILPSTITFGVTSIEAGNTVSFESSATTSITELILNSELGDSIHLKSSTPGAQAIVSVNESFCTDHLTLQDLGLTLPSGRIGHVGNSIDYGNNSGWTFSSCITNISEELETNISFYPNPVVNSLTLELQKGDLVSVEILSASGQQILMNSEVSSNTIDLSMLEDGHYFLKANTSMGAQVIPISILK